MSSISINRQNGISENTTRGVVTAVFATSNSVALTVLRIALGVVMLPHGLQKTIGAFGGPGFSATLAGFGSIGIPAALGVLAILAESAGSLALITGFGTRIAAFGIGVTMLVASQMHRANGFFMNWMGTQKGEGFEFHLLAIGMALALVMAGAGRWSVDRAIAPRD